jgi:hypothetical protein
MTNHIMDKCHCFLKMQQEAQQSVRNNHADEVHIISAVKLMNF